MTLNEIFGEKGNFINRYYDPYRLDHNNPYDVKVHEFLFDNGDLREGVKSLLMKFVADNKCGPWTDVVKLYYAEEHGSSTKGSYPAIYMWR
jgi:hypothetical protein